MNVKSIEFNGGAQQLYSDDNGVLKIADANGVYSISSDSEAAALIAVEVTNRNTAINTATGNTITYASTLYETLGRGATKLATSAATAIYHTIAAANILSASTVESANSYTNGVVAFYSKIVAVPSGSTDTTVGVAGNIAYDSSNFYVCAGSGTWLKFSGITSF